LFATAIQRIAESDMPRILQEQKPFQWKGNIRGWFCFSCSHPLKDLAASDIEEEKEDNSSENSIA
jgi:hypothetical protein